MTMFSTVRNLFNKLTGFDQVISLTVLYLLSFFFRGQLKAYQSAFQSYVAHNQLTITTLVMLFVCFLIAMELIYYGCCAITYRRACQKIKTSSEEIDTQALVDKIISAYVEPIYALNRLFMLPIMAYLLASNLIGFHLTALFASFSTADYVALTVAIISISCHVLPSLKNFVWRHLSFE
ncbi:hypothetical protein [Lentilactobacillus kefiri]|nr:hypothetical protein [Lentilactobacillus kefiri]